MAHPDGPHAHPDGPHAHPDSPHARADGPMAHTDPVPDPPPDTAPPHRALAPGAADPGDLEDGVTVIVPTHRGVRRISDCLRSLAAQTLHTRLFEIVVVLNGEPDGTRTVVERFRRAHAGLTVRVLELEEAGVSLARNAGLSAATRRFVTFVDDDDTVSPGYLETLLAAAEPGVVPLAQLVDVHEAGRVEVATPVNVQTVRYAGEVVHPELVPRALGFNACKLVPTTWARSVGYDTALRSGVDVAFFMALLARYDLRLRVCPVDSSPDARNGVYYRRVRPGSVSRQAESFEFNVIGRLEVISRIDALARGCPDQRRRSVMRSTIGSQARLIGRYLDARPAELDRVLDTIASYRLDDFPYDQLARGRARTLVVSYCFTPYSGTSGIVAAKRVRDQGEPVDVVYNAMDTVRGLDPGTALITRGLIDRDIRLATPTAFSGWRAIEAFCERGLAHLHESATAKSGYERLYSRVTWPASHFLAALYKIRHPEVRWSAEFSDPVSHGIDGRERTAPVTDGPVLAELRAEFRRRGLPEPTTDNALRWCEYVAFGFADEIVFTNENQRDYMLGRCELPELAARARELAVISPQPTLPSRFYHLVDSDYRLDPDAVNLGYFGAFYPTRGLDDVLTALAELPAQRRGRLRLHVFTNTPDALRSRAAALRVQDRVAINPYVPYLEFLNLTTRFDWLIVNDAATAGTHPCNPYLPSKWSDYRGSGTPVWGLVEPGSPLSRQPLHHTTTLGDVVAAREFLDSLVAQLTGRTAVPARR
ncbi:MAG: glycosyltransferase [Micromonosporaceae bacterium]|jgi:glycosyltransferase involved in cell wall biosynthesis